MVKQRFLRQPRGVAKPQPEEVSDADRKNVVELSAIAHHPVQIIPTEGKQKGSDRKWADLHPVNVSVFDHNRLDTEPRAFLGIRYEPNLRKSRLTPVFEKVLVRHKYKSVAH